MIRCISLRVYSCSANSDVFIYVRLLFRLFESKLLRNRGNSIKIGLSVKLILCKGIIGFPEDLQGVPSELRLGFVDLDFQCSTG